jgi:hypothetical protein
MSTKSHSHKRCGTLRKVNFPQGGMLKFTYKGCFLTIERHTKDYCIENPNGEHMLWCVFYIQDFLFLKKIKISIFGGITKFLKLIVFGKFGSFGQFWADSTTMVNTELVIHALDQVHCWGAYFRPGIGHYENFTPLNFQPFLFSKQ